MCKVMIIPGIKPENNDAAWKLARAARPFLTENDNDAFGYAALGDNGLFGERWTDPDLAFAPKYKLEAARRILEVLGINTTPDATEYNSFGERTERVHSLIMHARWATCGGGIENAHPFVIDNVALIHNGVISNAHQLENKISTCDSETILNAYLEARVSEDAERIQDVADVLVGWYAVGIIDANNGTVDIFRGGGAQLQAAYVKEVDTVVFCTTDAILKRAVKAAGFHMGPILSVPNEMLYRLDAYTGERIGYAAFNAGFREAVRQYSGTPTAYHGGYYEDDPTYSGVGTGEEAVERAIADAIHSGRMPVNPDRRHTPVAADEGSADEAEDTGTVIPVDEFIQRSSHGTGLSYADAAAARRRAKAYRRAYKRWEKKRQAKQNKASGGNNNV